MTNEQAQEKGQAEEVKEDWKRSEIRLKQDDQKCLEVNRLLGRHDVLNVNHLRSYNGYFFFHFLPSWSTCYVSHGTKEAPAEHCPLEGQFVALFFWWALEERHRKSWPDSLSWKLMRSFLTSWIQKSRNSDVGQQTMDWTNWHYYRLTYGYY